ncbi:unnamed protein product [Cylindrotheca closterium]|uniref:Uncharacterized protein n=1 Tax=Cylindrotheca closterium TaxID=2856 RepID=A0AAD2JKP2_9STRA|nr:unnamed protein product [Cylindrotheca closterium]
MLPVYENGESGMSFDVLSRSSAMNRTRSNNMVRNLPEHIQIQGSPDSETSDCKVYYNTDLRSFLHQLAQDSGDRGFEILPKHRLTPRCSIKRNSAPPVIDGATRKMLSCYAAVKSHRRKSCEFNRRDGGCAETSEVLAATVFDDKFLESVIDEVDSILYDDADDDLEDDDIQSQSGSA